MVEIPDEEYNRLVGRDQIAGLVETVWNDPALNPEAKALFKKKFPQIPIPDYDIRQEFNKRFDDDKRERVEAEKKKFDEEEKRKFEATRDKVKKDYSFTDDGMKDLEKFMVERNVGDYEVAAEYQARKNPKMSDASHDGFWHHTRQDQFAEIAKDPEGWARNEIMGAIRRDEEQSKGWR